MSIESIFCCSTQRKQTLYEEFLKWDKERFEDKELNSKTKRFQNFQNNTYFVIISVRKLRVNNLKKSNIDYWEKELPVKFTNF